jgi:2-phosphosulfolactate phosphatase
VTLPLEHGQAAYGRRFDWGLTGARALVRDARPGDIAVVVDVLSFTTTLTVALERGIAVYPYPWATQDATAYADQRGAVLARGRREGLSTGSVSLSPRSFEGVDATGIDGVVLPSPNGSSIAFALADAGVTVVGACLRNAPAVGRWLTSTVGRISLVAAGERWPDGALRPASEDLWGAGAVLSALVADLADEGASPEARSAVGAFAAVRDDLPSALAGCASGRELVEAGFADDVTVAAQYGVSEVVPLLDGERFLDERPRQVG